MLFAITTIFRAAYTKSGETQLKGLGKQSPRNADLSVASWVGSSQVPAQGVKALFGRYGADYEEEIKFTGN